ncbi:MAG: nitroreductase family protein [Candidatus Marinimicrobia bacterium]|nr:nitroreductase family protein [Candidatus Neomarinimicrobiota bacterium]
MKFEKLKFATLNSDEMLERSSHYLENLKSRRSVREFSSESIPLKVIKNIVSSASSAPSGANKQPWKFCIVKDLKLKKKIRVAAEFEEKENYEHRFPEEWLIDLNQFGTDWHKDFLEEAPYLIVLFKQVYDLKGGKQTKNYYVNESVGIAAGFLLTAIHNAGLIALTHTPSPMGFLEKILKRPKNERAFLLIPVGYPKAGTEVPVLTKKTFNEFAKIY